MIKTKSAASIHVLVDPNTDFGKTRHRWPFFKEELTRAAGESEAHFIGPDLSVAEGVAAAARAAAKTLVVFGDDATLHYAVNELMAMPEKSRPALGVFSSSAYGQGFFNSLAPHALKLSQAARMKLAVEMVVKGKAEAIDLGVAKFLNSAGKPEERFFLNIASYGVTPEIVAALPDIDSTLHSGLAFIAASVKSLLRYNAPEISVKADGKTIFAKKRIFNFFIANGSYGPAGMCIAPRADLRDGKLDCLLVPDAPVSELMMEVPKFWFSNAELQGSTRLVAMEIAARDHGLPGTQNSLRLELDGVLCGFFPASFQAKPRALRVLR